MKEKFYLPILFYFFIVGVALVFAVNINGEHLSFLESKAISILSKQPTQSPQPQPTSSSWSLLSKILEPDPDFDNSSLKVGSQDISYFEERYLRDSFGNVAFDGAGLPRKSRVVAKDPEREVALKLLNLKTGKTQTIKITKHGDELIAPEGYDIEVYERPSGIKWNAHNTYYIVRAPADNIVIRDVWPDIKYVNQTVTTTVKGKKKKTSVRVAVLDKNKPYVPYSVELKTGDTVELGIKNLKTVVTEAKKRLRNNNVMS